MKTKRTPTKKKTIVQEQQKNFETLRHAFLTDNVTLVDCILKSTKEHVAVICATTPKEDNTIELTPFAMIFNDNPYELLIPPLDPEYQKYD